MQAQHLPQRSPVGDAYPSVARWVNGYGWIALGQERPGRSFVRAGDEGGLIWEGDATYPTVDDAIQALDTALAAWLRAQQGE